MSDTLKGTKVLWVEDDMFLTDILAKRLTNEGAEVVHATNGEDALKLLEKHAPQVILLDILLSGIDGFEVLKRVKTNDKVKHIPVILLSNLGQKNDIDKGKELGAANFMVKATVTLDEIVQELKRVAAMGGSSTA